MRIFNESKTEELQEENCDLELGKFERDTLTIHIAGQEEIEKQSHYEVVRTYANGGQDVKEVIDVVGQPFIEEHDETEDILIYKPFTQQELLEKQNQKDLIILENWFTGDYTKYEQMLRRREFLNIADSITDNIRNKTYTSLAELYTEAEIVASEIKELRK